MPHTPRWPPDISRDLPQEPPPRMHRRSSQGELSTASQVAKFLLYADGRASLLLAVPPRQLCRFLDSAIAHDHPQRVASAHRLHCCPARHRPQVCSARRMTTTSRTSATPARLATSQPRKSAALHYAAWLQLLRVQARNACAGCAACRSICMRAGLSSCSTHLPDTAASHMACIPHSGSPS